MAAAYTVLVSLICVAPLVQVDTIALPGERPHVFLVEATGDGVADLCILEGLSVRIYPRGLPDNPIEVTLREGTRFFDVADLDGDGQPELIAARGGVVERYPLEADKANEPEALFTADTLFPEDAPYVVPLMLVTSYQGQRVVALPCEGAFKLYTGGGELLEEFPYEMDERNPDEVRYTFRINRFRKVGARNRNTFDYVIEESRDYVPVVPEGLEVHRPKPARYWNQFDPFLHEAYGHPVDTWPNFPLRPGEPDGRRVFAVLNPPSLQTTVVRIATEESAEGDADDSVEAGPPKTYTGALVLRDESPPDFNGDGYTDMMLWDAPEPGLSVGALSRALLGGAWPIRLRVHLFDPELERYAAKPASILRFNLPVSWYLNAGGSPLRQPRFHDMDGDGHTDFLTYVDEREMGIWFYDEGFREKPAQTITIPEELQRVPFAGDFGGGQTVIGIQGTGTLYVLRCKGE